MNPLPPDPYKALGVEKDADIGVIKTAYRKLVLKCHPDKVQDPELKAIKQDEFQRVQQAYEILSDEAKRKDYDDDVKFRKLREQFHKNMPQSSPRPSPKNYYEYNVNIRTAEPPPSFRPGPPPGAAPRSPYPGNPQFSSSWEHSMPSRSKPIYDEDRKARRAASYEKPRKDEESKEEKRRRREAEEQLQKDREREKRRLEREKERERDEKRERQRERDRAEKAAEREQREREARKAEEKRVKKERERKEKEADLQRRRQQDEKHSSKKPAYVEHHDESSDEHRSSKKKAAPSGSAKKPGHDSPRRDKSARRDGSPLDESKEKTEGALRAAADYMHNARRRGSKSGQSGAYYQEPPPSFSAQFPNPDETFRGPPETPRSRRPSYEERRFQPKVEEADEPEVVNVGPPEGKPPRLHKSFTSPPGTMHNMANTSVPRAPHLSRAQTMQPEYRPPPAAPPAPSPEEGRHSTKAERRRRGSMDAYEDDRPRRSMGHPNVVRYKLDEADMPRVVESSRYRAPEDVYFSPSGGPRSGASFHKVKVAPTYSPDQVYQGKRYDTEDVEYSKVDHVYHSPSGGYRYAAYVPAG